MEKEKYKELEFFLKKINSEEAKKMWEYIFKKIENNNSFDIVEKLMIITLMKFGIKMSKEWLECQLDEEKEEFN